MYTTPYCMDSGLPVPLVVLPALEHPSKEYHCVHDVDAAVKRGCLRLRGLLFRDYFLVLVRKTASNRAYWNFLGALQRGMKELQHITSMSVSTRRDERSKLDIQRGA